jgi:cell division protein FtsQ
VGKKLMQISLPFETAKGSNKQNSYRGDPRKLQRRLRSLLQLSMICLAFTGLSALCVACYRSLLTSSLLNVTSVQVSGCEVLDPQTVIQQAQIPSGVNILSLDLDRVRQRVTSHPWIASALISREIPDRIRIDIVERQPVALIKGRQFYLMDNGGVCFTGAEPGDYAGLPIITGLDPEILAPGCKLPREITVLIEDLYHESRLRLPWRLISEIRWRKNKGLSIFTVRGGIQIDLGRDSYGPKIARMEKVLRYLEEKGLDPHLRGIDLSHGNRIFVRGNFKAHKRDRPQKKGV